MSRPEPERRFLTDRMLGTLTRYLRFMGYDTRSANDLETGNSREDTLLLNRALEEDRILLTRDRELARRGQGHAVWIESEEVRAQVRQLSCLGLIEPRLRMNRCSLCNLPLRRATGEEIQKTRYAPRNPDLEFYWCERCHRLYWMGTHGANLHRRLEELAARDRSPEKED